MAADKSLNLSLEGSEEQAADLPFSAGSLNPGPGLDAK